MKPILEIQSVSKKYNIEHERQAYLSLRDWVANFSKRSREDFWALKDVSFNVMPGESIGIIGKNGAGKSTLLKILSKITPPTIGKIISRGRIASLLEVGTGFHPELTGRENVYLNGSILAMKKKEIDSKFDAIIDFAGTERFLDTPLKHYSSGMQLRLAFAVAAFLQPEILVIDEVLAVGDAEFQKKCIQKMEQVTESGRTILFVSHNMAAVERLCAKSILLAGGSVRLFDRTSHVIEEYTVNSDPSGNSGLYVAKHQNSPIQSVMLFYNGRQTHFVPMGGDLEVRVSFRTESPIEFPLLGIIIKDQQNLPLIGINNKHYQDNLAHSPLSGGVISALIPAVILFEGVYSIDVHFGNAFHDLQVIRDCCQLIVEPISFSKSGHLPDRKLNKVFIPNVSWKLLPIRDV